MNGNFRGNAAGSSSGQSNTFNTYYLEQIEKWNKTFALHNAEKIVLNQIELQKDFLRDTSVESAKAKDFTQLQQDRFKLLKAQMTKELEQTDWMYGTSNDNASRAFLASRNNFSNFR